MEEVENAYFAINDRVEICEEVNEIPYAAGIVEEIYDPDGDTAYDVRLDNGELLEEISETLLVEEGELET